MADTAPPQDRSFDTAPTYRVLARKYRPTHFGELIGQEPMVRTLRNAFAAGRIPQAWMLTGVRGVGKTTTARILARALNYEREGEGEERAPTVDFDAPGVHCKAIMEGRHVDVIEMDAASHTGINDIREITDAARYKPVNALYKVYIIDEVHMLSTAAFNGLLKTLEEPPAHVKFIFATTEIRKVPVTVLSRCQRFDLRRIETGTLADHLKYVAGAEDVSVEDEALTAIARAAEGSVRDALSLMDQAIAHGAGTVTAEDLRDTLGLADRARVLDLFEAVMKGDAAAALAELAAQYQVGADPVVVLTDLAGFVHEVTRQKVTGAATAGEAQAVRERSEAFAGTLGLAALSRMWQALLSGIAEVQGAPKPLVAAEMVLVRLCYMASLPEPDAMVLSAPPETGGHSAHKDAPVRGGGGASARRVEAVAGSAAPPAPLAPTGRQGHGQEPSRFEDLPFLLTGSVALKRAVEREMRPVRFEPGRIEVTLLPGAEANVAGELGKKLTELTGRRWIVTVSEAGEGPTLHEQHEMDQARLKREAQDEPLVRAILEHFADARVDAVRLTGEPEGTIEDSEAAAPQRRARNDS